jgi:hypothetical protein
VRDINVVVVRRARGLSTLRVIGHLGTTQRGSASAEAAAKLDVVGVHIKEMETAKSRGSTRPGAKAHGDRSSERSCIEPDRNSTSST